MKLDTYIAKRFLLARQKTKFVSLVGILAIGGIAVGVAALIVSLSIMNGFENEVRGRIIGTTSHINLHSLRSDNIGDWRHLLEIMKTRKDVVAAAPFVYSKVPIALKGKFDGMMVRGIIPSYERKLGNPESTLTEGDWLPETPDTANIPKIVLGKYLAQSIDAHPGDTALIYGLADPTGGRLTPKINRFVVSGIFESGLYDFDAMLAYINLESAQRIFEMGDAVTGIELRVHNFYDADKIARRIDDDLGFPYYTMSWAQMNKNLFSWMTLEKWGLFLLLTLIVAVAAFNIASTLIMVVMEKTQDIGILRAIGAPAGMIRRVFLLQGLFLGGLGASLGLAIGFVLSFIQQEFSLISLPADVYSISSLPVEMHIRDFVAIGLATLALTVISSLYPAWRASKLTPIDAIRK
jgi:lipoprotein-releasing system permease protein